MMVYVKLKCKYGLNRGLDIIHEESPTFLNLSTHSKFILRFFFVKVVKNEL